MLVLLGLVSLVGTLACVPMSAAPVGVGPAPAVAMEAPNAIAPLPTSISLTASEFKFTPSTFSVPAGKPIAITFQNKGAVDHDFTVPSLSFTLAAPAGQTAKGTVTFPKPGTYDFICSVAGHAQAGMKGTITVTGADGTAPEPAAASASPSASMGGMSMGGSSAIQPVPAGTTRLPAVQVAPPVTRTAPALVHYDLTTQKTIATMADGVAVEYWTFNGTVPGPMLRVRQGDTVEITLHNSPDAGTIHSIDLHAVSGPGGGATVTQVRPGESATFRFKALAPGVFIYHCATPMVAEHIASGMYGMIVVEPPGGLPPVDHEYYVMQSDFYLQGNRDTVGLRPFDVTKMLNEQPDYVVFNGSVGSLTGANALKASVGDKIRIFFGVGGPNLTSSFHVIGGIFDKVFPEGSLTSAPETNVQTTHVPAGGATMVELTPKEPGTYTFVDHSIGRMEKGASGQIVVTGTADPSIFQVVQAGTGGSGGH